MLKKIFLFFIVLFSFNTFAAKKETINDIKSLEELNVFITDYSKKFQTRDDKYGIVNKLYIKDNVINYDYILDNGVFVSMKAVKQVIFNVGSDFREGYCEDPQFLQIQKLSVPIKINYFHEDDDSAIYKLSIQEEDCIDT